MEQMLKPDRLTLDPRATGASNTFDHWLKCFQDYIDASTAIQNDADRLRVLHARVSDTVYSSIRDAQDYKGAIELLKKLYNKPPNEIHARHLLATRRRQPGETTGQYLRKLQQLARACNCKPVSTAQYTNDLIRDAFVAGIGSSYIRLPLLEQGNLDLAKTVELADTMETASRSPETYPTDHVGTSWQVQPPTQLYPAAPKNCAIVLSTSDLTTAAAPGGPRCYFCGLAKHPRQRCPARTVFCSACGKKGHYAKVCRAKPPSKLSSAACDSPEPVSLSPASSRSSTTCDSRAPPFLMTKTQDTCDLQGPPLLAPPTTCDPWAQPFWSAPTADDQQGSSSSTTSAACSCTQDPTVASIILDQAKPHRLDKSMMGIELA
ncbi:uncharacterized protein LOC144509418 [Mustelus asterias]